MSKSPATPHRFVTAAVFTDRMFLGNPVAVVLDAGELSTAQMQAIACEFNYTETTLMLVAKSAALSPSRSQCPPSDQRPRGNQAW